jgi:hypothetical protein
MIIFMNFANLQFFKFFNFFLYFFEIFFYSQRISQKNEHQNPQVTPIFFHFQSLSIVQPKMSSKFSPLLIIAVTFVNFSSQNVFDINRFEVHTPQSVTNCINDKVQSLKNKKDERPSQNVQDIYQNAEILCSENFEGSIVTSFDEIVSNLKADNEVNDEIRYFESCLKFILLKRNDTGPLAATFDRSLLETFKNDQKCQEIERKNAENEIGDRECIDRAPAFNGNLKVNLMSIAHYAREIVEAERKIFVDDTRSQLEFHMNCLIEKENLK